MISSPFLFQGLLLDPISMPQAVETLLGWASGDELKILSTPNASFLRLSQTDAVLRRSVLTSDLSTIDGMPLVALSRALGVDIPERVAGSDLVMALDARLRSEGKSLRVFFFGGRDGAAQAAHENWIRKESGLVSCGWLNPGFGRVDDMSGPDVLSKINDANPDFIIVSLGAQKGQSWILRNRGLLNARIVSHLGAVVDFVAGDIRRSPRWISEAGMEWVWRIKEEPLLWRRYALDAGVLARSVGSVLGERAQSKAASKKDEDHSGSIRVSGTETEEITVSMDGHFNADCKAECDDAVAQIKLIAAEAPKKRLKLDCSQAALIDIHAQAHTLRALRGLDGAFAQISLENLSPALKTSLTRNKFLDCLRLYQSPSLFLMI